MDRHKKWSEKNKVSENERKAKWRKENPERMKEYLRLWREKNSDYFANYRKNNPHLSVVYRKTHYTKNKTNEHHLILTNIRRRLRSFLKKGSVTQKIDNYLGCDISFLKKYLEGKFTEGMSWENYGLKGWHIDHIYPLSKIDTTNEEEVKMVCHYTNLQPLWAVDNIKKGNKVVHIDF